MSHYAKIVNGKVVQVIVAEADFFNIFVDTTPGKWLQTSYNTRKNVHLGPDGEPDGGVALRGNFAGIGYIYDEANDVFYEEKPYSSWILDESTWTWNPPVPMPVNGNKYLWNESTKSWDIVEQPTATPIQSAT